MDYRESGTDGAVALMELMDSGMEVETCREWVRMRFRGLLLGLALAGFGKARVIVGSRTFEEQCRLYGRGRSADEMAVIGVSGGYADPGTSRVSWIDPRYSRHVQGLAIDVCFRAYEVRELSPIGEVVHQLGITWGGVWSVRDYAHFEL